MHRPLDKAHRWTLSLFALAALAAAGCDDPPKAKGGPAASAITTAAKVADSAQAAPKPKGMPELTVDDDGPYLAGTRINLTDPAANGPEKLVKVTKDLPIEGKPVTLLATKKAKVSYVAAVVAALGDAGAPKVTIKTDGRDDLPKQIDVTPEVKLSSLPACSITTMILKDLSTAIWTIKGGTAKRQRKGLAGPDLSQTRDQLTKDIAACESTIAFFSGDDSAGWEATFNLAGSVLVSDEKKKIDTLVLVKETPVAGRAVTLSKH